MFTTAEFNSRITGAFDDLSNQELQPRKFKLSVKKKYDGFTLLDMYVQCFPHAASDYWREKIISKNLTLDGQSVSPEKIVRAGQITQHTVPAKPEPLINPRIKLIAATSNFWIINKPSPLPVHAGGRYELHTLTNVLNRAFPEKSIHLVNRLDANTTGIVLVALNKETAQILGKQFENREVTKTYLALVEGYSSETKFNSSKSISKTKTPAGGRKLEDGHDSNTDFEVLKTFGSKSLLKVTPHSGRTNQIRLHLADLGLPIVGDLGYANPEYFEKNPLTYSKDSLFLHAWKLQFMDPVVGEMLEFEADTNEKWDSYLDDNLVQ